MSLDRNFTVPHKSVSVENRKVLKHLEGIQYLTYAYDMVVMVLTVALSRY